jgi:MFS transporter, MHS family, proline/betaine transporter
MRLNRKVMGASIIGGILEIYDLTVYGLMASILAPIFFNPADPFSSLVQSYGAFSVGFLARPIGALIFGHIGDTFGRKWALVLSSTLMAFSTLALGLLPTYEMIGVWASVSVFIIRILQGISVGGEYSGGIILAIEHAPKDRRGAAGSSVVAGYMGGIFLGSLTSFLFTLSFMPSWGWRLPFLFGFLIVGVGIYIRSCIQESQEFSDSRKSTNAPFLRDILRAPSLFISCIGCAGFAGVFCYTLAVYIPTYLKENFLLSKSLTMFIPILSTFTMMIGNVLFGPLSDRWGRIPLMKFGALLTTLLAFPFVYLLNSGDFTIGFLSLIVIGFVSTMFCGPMNVLVVEVFNPTHRYRSAALCYALGMSIFGGTAPLIASWITKLNDGPFFLSCYFCIAGFMGWGAAKFIEARSAVPYHDLQKELAFENSGQLVT